MQRLTRMTNWLLKKEVEFLKKEYCKYADINSVENQLRQEARRVELTKESTRLNQHVVNTEQLKHQYESVLRIVRAEARIKELQASIHVYMQIQEQGPILEEMTALNKLTLGKNDVRDLIPRNNSVEESERQLQDATDNCNHARELQAACQAQILQLDAESKRCCAEMTQLAQALDAAEQLLAKRLLTSHPEHEAYHDAWQELQNTLNKKPENANELINDLYFYGQQFLGGVLSSDKLTKTQKTTLLVAANEIVNQPLDEKCMQRFSQALSINQENISILAVVAGITLLSLTVLGLMLSLAVGATGFGIPIMLAGLTATAITGMISASLITSSLSSPVTSSGQQLLSTAHHYMYFSKALTLSHEPPLSNHTSNNNESRLG